MAKRITWRSNGDVWVFEEGQKARVTRRGQAREEQVSFSVLKVIDGNHVLTDLEGISRDDWKGPLLFWAGDSELHEE